MNPEFYKMAVIACSEVYDKNIKLSLGTEYSHFLTKIGGKAFQVIAVAGTDDLIDMVKNINLLSRKGIKLSAYRAAKRIMKDVDLCPGIPIIATGHSLGGAVVIALKKMFKIIDYCIAFAPARCLRYWSKRKMENTTIFTDPDDIVSNLLAIVSFGLPICNRIKSRKNHWSWSIKDHKIGHWKEFIKKIYGD